MAKIGVDYTPACEQGGGIGRYVRELTAALLHVPTQHTFRLFAAGVPPINQLPQLPSHASWRTTNLSTKWLARIWHRARLPLAVETWVGDVDLYHSTDFVLPPTHRPTRTILTVHDLSFIRTPEAASPRLRRYLSEVVPRSVRRADHILADSEATRADLIELYRTPPEKITVLLSGVSRQFHPVTDVAQHRAVRHKYHIGERPYIFSIGTVQPRKNYARLVEALATLRAGGTDIDLVIAGGRGWLDDDIYTALDTFNVREHVHFIGYADEADLPTLYSAAVCSSFVSLYEGFGLPVLESMACGCPVLTSNVSSLPEVAGNAAPTVAPHEVEAITFWLNRMLHDSDYRELCRARGFEQATRFTWERAAQQLMTVYDDTLTLDAQ